MKLYIAGPMSGLPDYNYPAFELAERQLRAAGHDPVSPAGEPVEGWGWGEYMRRSLKLFLDCEAVALLPGWGASRGAGIERDLAGKLEMRVLTVEQWLRHRKSDILMSTGPGAKVPPHHAACYGVTEEERMALVRRKHAEPVPTSVRRGSTESFDAWWKRATEPSPRAGL